jgi:hypothetical protein
MRRMLKRDIFRTPYFIPRRPISSFVSYFCLNQWRLYFCNSFPLARRCARSVRSVAARSTSGFLLPRWVDVAEEAGGGGEKWWRRTGAVRAARGGGGGGVNASPGGGLLWGAVTTMRCQIRVYGLS